MPALDPMPPPPARSIAARPAPPPREASPAAAQKPFASSADSSALTDDSLSEWVGEALAAFTGEASDPAVQPIEFDVSSDPDSPAGVADPVIFGRSAAQTVDPRDDFADPTPLRFESSFATETSSVAEPHRRGVPDSIPPFRRAGDPGVRPSPARAPIPRPAPARDEDEVVASMWRPAPEEAAPPDPDWDSPAGSTFGDSRRRDEIADSVLRDSLSSLPRAILLGAGRTGVVGWRGRGRGLTAEAVAAIRVPHSEISVFSAVQQSGVPHFAVTERSEWPRALADLFGPKPLDCAIFPIRVSDGVAAFLYADRMGEPMHYEDFALIARAAASAAGVLSRFLLPSTPPGSRVGS